MAETETGWYPDCIFRSGQFESGVALFADKNGRITRISPEPEDLQSAKRLPGTAILPGFVNVHSHAFQRAIRGRVERPTGAAQGNFWTWREAMYCAANKLTPEDLFDVSRMAFLEMLLAGITTVGEFHYLHHAPDGRRYRDPNLLAKTVIRAAVEMGLRIVLLRAAYARAGWQTQPDPRQRRFIINDPEEFLRQTDDLRSTIRDFPRNMVFVGMAPHSVRAVPLAYLRECTEYASKRDLALHMHVAEQPAEVEACLAEYGRRPVELLQENNLLGPNLTAVHATHTTDEEIASLAEAGANICVCPTTERNLGDGIAPADRWAAANINVCFGTDANIQIDPLEDARELEYHLRLKHLARSIFPASKLLEQTTLAGARSLLIKAGELAPGAPADFSVLDLNNVSIAGSDRESLAEAIAFAAQRGAIRCVYVAGHRVIEDGAHRQQNEIIERFRRVQQRLWIESL